MPGRDSKKIEPEKDYHAITTIDVLMGWYCLICERYHSNESFTGRGRRKHVCRKSSRLPKVVREEILLRREIEGFLEQSHISKKNLKRLRFLSESKIPTIAELAALVLEIAHATPFKRKRIRNLARERRDLIERMERLELLLPRLDFADGFDSADYEPDYPDESYFLDEERVQTILSQLDSKSALLEIAELPF